MDVVRFGRALGYGTRHAAKALAEAAKAASAPAPGERPVSRPAASQAATPPTAARVPTLAEAGARVADAHRAVSTTNAHMRTQAARAGRSAFAPVKRAGSVLWLELTGSVFALFALFFAQGLWKLREGFHAPFSSSEAHKSYGYLLVLLVFVYFAVSSFVRANRRGKRP